MKFKQSLLVRAHMLAVVVAVTFSGAAFAAGPSEFVIYSFPTLGRPSGNLAVDAAGNLHGTTIEGGTSLSGTIYELLRPVPPSTEHDLD
jgi:hypothetical protein